MNSKMNDRNMTGNSTFESALARGVGIETVTAFALVLVREVGAVVHPRGVVPDEERLAGSLCAFDRERCGTAAL